jgi:hypothetical protein
MTQPINAQETINPSSELEAFSERPKGMTKNLFKDSIALEMTTVSHIQTKILRGQPQGEYHIFYSFYPSPHSKFY